MPKIALTDAAVKKLKPPATGQLDIFDKHYPGLVLRLGARTRTWYCMVRVGKRLVRHRLACYPDKSLGEARELWRKTRETVDAGKPPRAAPLNRDAVESVVAEWLKRDQADNATYAEVKAAFHALVIPEWSGRLVTSIDRRDVLDILDAIADRGKIGRANKLHAWLSRFFTWSVGRGVIAQSPMAKLPKHGAPVVRDRALSDPEIAALWRACKALGWPYGSAVQILLLTLARREEIVGLRREEIDAAAALIRLPAKRVKNDQARIIPLGPLAWRILQDGPRIAGSPFVFTSGTGSTPVSGWSKAKAALDRAMGVNEPWRLHDLRRTGATGLERMGVPLPVTEAVLGHTSGSKAGIVRVYQQHDYEAEKRAALGKWAGHVLALVG
ncbi:MAG TPA: tyrosine-type recombinase/integrase [Hyphomicrobiaceae bacterium]|nr:tyrosine-type recombinase/integrase [Hyphomicrobiaceae bacterium]